MAEHKHAEVLRAIADGKAVQFKIEEANIWFEAEFISYTPLTHPELEWRAKPEPKSDYCLYAGYDGSSDGGMLFVRSIEVGRNWAYKIKITIDGETNEPKSVELIK